MKRFLKPLPPVVGWNLLGGSPIFQYNPAEHHYPTCPRPHPICFPSPLIDRLAAFFFPPLFHCPPRQRFSISVFPGAREGCNVSFPGCFLFRSVSVPLSAVPQAVPDHWQKPGLPPFFSPPRFVQASNLLDDAADSVLVPPPRRDHPHPPQTPPPSPFDECTLSNLFPQREKPVNLFLGTCSGKSDPFDLWPLSPPVSTILNLLQPHTGGPLPLPPSPTPPPNRYRVKKQLVRLPFLDPTFRHTTSFRFHGPNLSDFTVRKQSFPRGQG